MEWEEGGGGKEVRKFSSGLKIVTYNVNGLRSRVSQHNSLLKLLDSLDADIICFQETKLSRQDLSVELTMADGYESFVSCTRTTSRGRTCYSGVITFCRVNSPFCSNEVALPLSAEEGITGLLGYSRNSEFIKRGPFLKGLEDITTDDLLKIDNEGRCVITDHGHFVLFNIYGPRAQHDDSERLQFKFLFFLILQKRWEYLCNKGNRVFVVGDFNIAPATIDCCDATPDFEDNRFRKWFRTMLMENGGPFVDCFRGMNPDRKEAYTCWPQSVRGEEFNFGSRIDHIIVAGPCFHQHTYIEGHNIFECHVEECDIKIQFQRGKLDDIQKSKGGRSVKMEGSDHVPVYVLLRDIPNLSVHDTPFFAARYIPEIRGQQTISSVLMKRQVGIGIEHSEESCSSIKNDILDTNCGNLMDSNQNIETLEYDSVQNIHVPLTNEDMPSSNDFVKEKFRSTSKESESKKKELLLTQTVPLSKKTRHSGFSQLSIRSFFQQSKNFSHDAVGTSHGQSHTTEANFDTSPVTSACEVNQSISQGDMSDFDLKECSEIQCGISSSEMKKDNIALLEWEKIRQKMQNSLPVCKGHGEPCVARSVKKTGPNVGRGFYVCARAKGPVSNSEANCGHFEWASSRTTKKRR